MTKLRFVILAVLAASGLVFTACGESQKVGSEKLLEGIDENGGGGRLGERTAAPATASPAALAVDAPKKTPSVQPTPKPEATPAYFDVTLITDSPYYKPGNKISIRKGVTLRITNSDMTPERSKGRSFTDKHGSFHSGLIKPGGNWTWKFTAVGNYEIIDEGLNFATALLQVTP